MGNNLKGHLNSNLNDGFHRVGHNCVIFEFARSLPSVVPYCIAVRPQGRSSLCFLMGIFGYSSPLSYLTQFDGPFLWLLKLMKEGQNILFSSDNGKVRK